MSFLAANAEYFDGCSSRSRPVEARLCGNSVLQIRGEGVSLEVERTALRVGERVGRATWSVELSGGGGLAFAPTAEAEALLAALERRGAARFVQSFEHSRRWAVAALLLVVFAAWAFVVHGLPTLAARGAALVPHDVELVLGEEGLRWLDELLEPSALDEDRKAAIVGLFARAASTMPLPSAPRLELRRGEGIGANAFALPGGIVVMTDELVELSRHDDELVAVFAHELGHVFHRHTLRRLLQSSAVALLATLVTSDISSVTTLGTTIPTVLLEAGFSREMEREADDFALTTMDAAGVGHEHFAAILERLEASTGSGSIPEFLSSHPSTRARVENANR
ncbi:MAG: M48 family metallopeptidase [Planctomycetes bacterium]|nr:M48 family metallopeptidase [Planctomycetota bacterium]